MEDLRNVEAAHAGIKTVEKPSLGRAVHYVIPFGPRKGEHRVAIITSPWGFSPVNLQMFRDQADDPCVDLCADHFGCIHKGGGFGVDVYAMATLPIRSARHDEDGKAPGTWHYPEEK